MWMDVDGCGWMWMDVDGCGWMWMRIGIARCDECWDFLCIGEVETTTSECFGVYFVMNFY